MSTMENELRELLKEPMMAERVFEHAKNLGISERTVKIAKKNIGVITTKVAGGWQWSLPQAAACRTIAGYARTPIKISGGINESQKQTRRVPRD